MSHGVDAQTSRSSSLMRAPAGSVATCRVRVTTALGAAGAGATDAVGATATATGAAGAAVTTSTDRERTNTIPANPIATTTPAASTAGNLLGGGAGRSEATLA